MLPTLEAAAFMSLAADFPKDFRTRRNAYTEWTQNTHHRRNL